MQTKLRLDGIVTLVDARHVWQHIDESDEVKEQIAFADVILLNKIDLVTPAELDKLEARIRSMNAAAKIYRTQDSAAHRRQFLMWAASISIVRWKSTRRFMEPEYPFEWAGIYALPSGTARLTLDKGPDPSMSMAILHVDGPTHNDLQAAEMDAVLLFSEAEQKTPTGSRIRPGGVHDELTLDGKPAAFEIEIPKDGYYAFFTEHRPEEFHAELHVGGAARAAEFQREYKPDHEHDEAVSSVGIAVSGDLDKKKFNQWLSHLLQTQGTDIFRMKGVLSLRGEANRFVFQGVHMLFDGRPDRPWKEAERHNQLIFIGRNLDRNQLNEGFRSCLV